MQYTTKDNDCNDKIAQHMPIIADQETILFVYVGLSRRVFIKIRKGKDRQFDAQWIAVRYYKRITTKGRKSNLKQLI